MKREGVRPRFVSISGLAEDSKLADEIVRQYDLVVSEFQR